MKKALKTAFFAFLAFFFLSAETVFAHHETPFSDVASTHPNYAAIEYFRVRNMVKGYDDGNFHPGRRINRAEFITMITRIVKADPDEDEFKNCFSDVRKQWFADEVCYAKSEGWLDGIVTNRSFRPSRKVSASEAYKIATRAFDVYNINAENNFIGSLTRGDAAQMLYQVMLAAIQKGAYTAPGLYSTPAPSAISSSGANPYAVNLPPGYGTPWIPSGVSTQSTTYSPVYSYTPSYTPSYGQNTSACSAAGISTYPSYTAATYSVNYCALDDTGAPSTQLLLGQASLSNVWGQPLNFTITERMRAMALGYVSEMFRINPNYLLGLMIKESKGDCGYYGGCFQITGGFPEVKNRYPLYFDANDSESALINSFGTAAVIATLYIRFGEALWNRDYQWSNFYQSASDIEARAKIVSRGYNRGLWDPAIRDMLQTNRAQCQMASNTFQCFPSGDITTANGIALDHAQAVVGYCRSLMQSANFYDAQLTRQDVTDFIEQVLKPTFSQTSNVNWPQIQQQATNAFSCLQNSNGTISFRYDFKKLIQSIKQILPTVPAPIL